MEVVSGHPGYSQTAKEIQDEREEGRNRKQQWPYQREVSKCRTPGLPLSLEPPLVCYHPAKQGGFEIGTFLHVTIVPADRPLDYLAIHSFATIVTLCRFPLHNSGFIERFYSPTQVFLKWYYSSCLKRPFGTLEFSIAYIFVCVLKYGWSEKGLTS